MASREYGARRLLDKGVDVEKVLNEGLVAGMKDVRGLDFNFHSFFSAFSEIS